MQQEAIQRIKIHRIERKKEKKDNHAEAMDLGDTPQPYSTFVHIQQRAIKLLSS